MTCFYRAVKERGGGAGAAALYGGGFSLVAVNVTPTKMKNSSEKSLLTVL